MARSLKKGPYVDVKLLKKVRKMEESGRKAPIKTWARSSMIAPELWVTHLPFTTAKYLFLYLLQRTWWGTGWVNFHRLVDSEPTVSQRKRRFVDFFNGKTGF
jgi:hypothetical protein